MAMGADFFDLVISPEELEEGEALFNNKCVN
jgi:hypothetical protein